MVSGTCLFLGNLSSMMVSNFGGEVLFLSWLEIEISISFLMKSLKWKYMLFKDY